MNENVSAVEDDLEARTLFRKQRTYVLRWYGSVTPVYRQYLHNRMVSVKLPIMYQSMCFSLVFFKLRFTQKQPFCAKSIP